ncbi:MAG: sigma 54-interacting transcriptional regulator, partial [Deltaproteobacteria bacterium]|nr:sigma 54-interacting transcriptional regulator [Deltaproteobacteria bacterium]
STERVLDCFFRISTLITTRASLSDILQKILDEVVDTMGFQRGLICLLDDAKENLITKVVKNYSPEEARRAFASDMNLNLKKHDCLETMVAKTGNHIVLEDSATDSRITETDRMITSVYRRGSSVYAPLKTGKEVIGIISVWSKEKIKYTPEEINTILTFANQVSIVIQNAKLLKENKRKISWLMMLQEALSKLNATYDLESMHDIVIESAKRIGDSDRAILYFLDVVKNTTLISDGEAVYTDKNDVYLSKLDDSIIKEALDSEMIVSQSILQSAGTPLLLNDCTAEIAIPMKIKDKFKGAIYLAKKEGAYGENDKNILDIFAKNVAISYDGAIMHSMLSLTAKSLKKEVETLKERENQLMGFHSIIGSSDKMLKIFDIVKDVANHDTNILLQGESGTGKELIARAIHRQSDRKSRHFVDVNCAAIPGSLLESELFGYEAGAFTDAKKRKIGLLEYASGGTLLLDEIGEMGLSVQAKFLRMLEDNCVRRLGGNESVPVDVRFIFSTNRDLVDMLAEGTFREDLFYRISVVPIKLPPLRERDEDIVSLANYYVEEFNAKFHKRVNGFTREAEELLRRYAWPGNVRELRNVIERVMILQNVRAVIGSENLPAELLRKESQSLEMALDESIPLRFSYPLDYKSKVSETTNMIREGLIAKALESSNSNKTAAARLLGISRYTLIRELKKLGNSAGTQEKLN